MTLASPTCGWTECTQLYEGTFESGLLPGLVALVDHRGREHVEAIGKMAFDSAQRTPHSVDRASPNNG
jgi:hypothetical protein